MWPGILVELHVDTCSMHRLVEAVVLEEIQTNSMACCMFFEKEQSITEQR